MVDDPLIPYEHGSAIYCGVPVVYERVGDTVYFWDSEMVGERKEMPWADFFSHCEPTK